MQEQQIYIKPWYGKWFQANTETAKKFCRHLMNGMTCKDEEKKCRIEQYHLKGISIDDLMAL